jgi:hypothetical protein
MLKVLSLAAALLLVASVAFGGIIDPCLSTATSAGGCVMVCPAGDGDQMSDQGATISITIVDGSSVAIEGIPATDFYVIDCDPVNDMTLCGGASSSNATAATDVNGQTTMEGDIAAGGCADGVAVVVQGFVIQDSPACTVPTCLSILIRSPDMNGDLVVNLADFSAFGLAYPPNAYNKCADFNCDASVNLQDFSTFGLHYQHSCQ